MSIPAHEGEFKSLPFHKELLFAGPIRGNSKPKQCDPKCHRDRPGESTIPLDITILASQIKVGKDHHCHGENSITRTKGGGYPGPIVGPKAGHGHRGHYEKEHRIIQSGVTCEEPIFGGNDKDDQEENA